MGFLDWTVWGMGLSALAALIFLGLALLTQTSGFARRNGLSGSRLMQRVRALTGYAFAFLLLAVGFFLAGVPIGQPAEATAVAVQTVIVTATLDQTSETSEAATPSPEPPTPATPESGAFGGPPVSATAASDEATPIGTTSGTAEATIQSSPTPDVEEAETTTTIPTPSATDTLSPTPTQTPSPTLTPTPITGQTAAVAIGGGTVWLSRSPGGQNLLLLNDGDLVLVLPGHANQGGILWQEISTVTGVEGWIQEEFLDFTPDES